MAVHQWGAMDGDMVARARASGLAVEWIDNRTSMLHQWHPRKHSSLTSVSLREAAKRAWRDNHAMARIRNAKGLARRNPNAWGGAP
jgi:hypothetical protein